MRFGVSANLQITYRILPDGSAQVEDIVFLEGGKRFDKSFRATAKKWLESSRFYPERVDGAPVSTRESITLAFGVGTGIDSKYRQAVDERLTDCQAALTARNADTRQLALDSAFHLIPAN